MDFIKTEGNEKTLRQKCYLRKLRLSLKYRPDLLKKILKMRLCIRKKNLLLANMKQQLKIMMMKYMEKEVADQITQTDCEHMFLNQHVSTQTDNDTSNENEGPNNNDDCKHTKTSDSVDEKTKDLGWDIGKDDTKAISIADQVKEVAQSALQQTGMVYVESAGMYYDYKTGYYYNSELGLYYHPDTQCYYYYSDEKQTFVFHSYPDRSQEVANAGLIAHEKKKKAKKHKKDWRTDDSIDNLTKNLSQEKADGPEDTTKSKRRKIQKKKLDDKFISDEHKNANGMENKNETNEIDVNIPDKIESKENETVEQVTERKLKDAVLASDKTVVEDNDLEDGECSETESEHSDVETEDTHDSTSTASDDDAVAKHHPPCMRVIVKDTTLPKLKVGSLFLVTKDGGSIGREGEHHCIVLRDENVSRNHLNITYDMMKRSYVAMDLGSKNGTILNGTRMSESQTVSKSTEIIHGSTLEIGETKLLCHIHPGTDTCGHCEPGLLMEISEEKKAAYTRTCSVQKQHQLELARLKNKYAPKPLAIEATAYNDRAQARREKVGSSHHSQKTQSSDLDTFIAPENKGFKLLEKMGWSKGEGLGKDNQGDTEPIPMISNEGKAGLGTGGAVLPDSSPIPSRLTNKLGSATLKLASLTKMLKPPAKAFQNTDDDEDDEE
ncbi:unnamed protein product [Chilo suppressalis]|uniref:Angiogenic factor with G patch and FHA domains 1 n=1 Tax=Chilo suppressalis TaxID=168631 RepID=A0ABN8AY51_CHISP|nr:unnamed protein product [Chilo suppressalis]